MTVQETRNLKSCYLISSLVSNSTNHTVFESLTSSKKTMDNKIVCGRQLPRRPIEISFFTSPLKRTGRCQQQQDTPVRIQIGYDPTFNDEGTNFIMCRRGNDEAVLRRCRWDTVQTSHMAEVAKSRIHQQFQQPHEDQVRMGGATQLGQPEETDSVAGASKRGVNDDDAVVDIVPSDSVKGNAVAVTDLSVVDDNGDKDAKKPSGDDDVSIDYDEDLFGSDDEVAANQDEEREEQEEVSDMKQEEQEIVDMKQEGQEVATIDDDDEDEDSLFTMEEEDKKQPSNRKRKRDDVQHEPTKGEIYFYEHRDEIWPLYFLLRFLDQDRPPEVDIEYQLTIVGTNLIESLLEEHFHACGDGFDEKMKSIEDYLSDGLKVTIRNVWTIRNEKEWSYPGQYYLEDPYKYLLDVNWCIFGIIQESQRVKEDFTLGRFLLNIISFSFSVG